MVTVGDHMENGEISDDSEGWNEISDPDSVTSLTCLVCSHTVTGVKTFFDHLLSHEKWNNFFTGNCRINDQYDWIRFVNFVRMRKPNDWQEVFRDPCWSTKSEESFHPVLKDDAVLSIDIESILEEYGVKPTEVESPQAEAPNAADTDGGMLRLLDENAALREKLITCRRLLANLVTQPENGGHPKVEEDGEGGDCESESDPDKLDGIKVLDDLSDSAYFTSYGHFAIHSEMLADRIRTESYRDFILSNASTLFAGKRVLDVGCGSGILSLFATEAGASHVFGVDASSDILSAARETLQANGMDDRITLFRNRAEDVKLPVDKVDVIISEWMGYFLLYESMLDSVLHVARRYLASPHGRIYPRHYTLLLTAMQTGRRLRKDHVDLWADVYGYRMPALRRASLSEAHVIDLFTACLQTAGIEDVSASAEKPRLLTSTPCELYSLDLADPDLLSKPPSAGDTLQLGQLAFQLKIDATNVGSCREENGSSDASNFMLMDALVGYFDVRFDDDAPVKIGFSTGPTAPRTHWKQTVFFLDHPLKVQCGDLITGSLTVRRSLYDCRGLEFALIIDSIHDQAADFRVFLDPDFDHKQWINEVLKSAVLEHNVEQKASDLFVLLQAQMRDVMQSIDSACRDAVHSVPRVLREMDNLRQDATALGTELGSMHESIGQVDATSQESIVHLIQLDQTRRNAQAAANALRATDRWLGLVQGIEELLSSGELDQACCHLEGMDECLLTLTRLPDYSDRLDMVAKYKNSLESLIAPQLIRALDHTLPEDSGWIHVTSMGATADPRMEVRHWIDLLQRIGREEAGVKYYTSWLKSQISSQWDLSTSKTNDTLQSVPSDIEALMHDLAQFEFCKQPNSLCAELDPSSLDSTTVGAVKQHTRAVLSFHAHLIRFFQLQLDSGLFDQSHASVVMNGFVEALHHNRDAREAYMVIGLSEKSALRIDEIAYSLGIALGSCSMLGDQLEAHYPGVLSNKTPSKTSTTGTQDRVIQLCNDLSTELLQPFCRMGELFGCQLRGKFEKELKQISWASETLTDLVESLCQTILRVVRLIEDAGQLCFQTTLGLGMPYFLSIIEYFWDTLLAKLTLAIDRFVERLIRQDSKPNASQAMGFKRALEIASLTGELSLQSDAFVELLLNKCGDVFSKVFANKESCPLNASGHFHWLDPVGESTTDAANSADWSLLHQLVMTQSPECRHALFAFAHPLSEPLTHAAPSTGKSATTTSIALQSHLSGLHRANVLACRAAVSALRRVTLAPLRGVLQQVPTLAVWSSRPDSGDVTLPQLAYLPQDYITQIGQYVFALPEHLEPYAVLTQPSSSEWTESRLDRLAEEQRSPRGLAECLHLGDPDSTLSSNPPVVDDTTTTTGGAAAGRRTRLTSLSVAAAATSADRKEESVTVFCWFESFVSGAVCNLLMSTLLRLGSSGGGGAATTSNAKRPSQGRADGHSSSAAGESDSELEDRVLLTEHGAKQLEVDLGYMQNLLVDLGMNFPGNLQALRDLIGCSADQFATLSAGCAPRIANTVARLRGL